MNVWYHKTKLATWANLNELRAEESDIDYITNDRYVFHVGSYRIVAMIFFKAQQLYPGDFHAQGIRQTASATPHPVGRPATSPSKPT